MTVAWSSKPFHCPIRKPDAPSTPGDLWSITWTPMPGQPRHFSGSSLSTDSYTWVHCNSQDVNQQVHDDVSQGHDDHRRLHNGIIAGEDGVQQQPSHSWVGKDGFRNDSSTEQRPELQALQGHYRQESITQCVPKRDSYFRQTL